MPPLNKHQLLYWISRAKLSKNEAYELNFVEGGTFRGESTQVAAGVFSNLWTIEIDSKLWQTAADKFKTNPRIKCLLGDTSVILPNLCSSISSPAFFWLDAHWSMGDTSFGSKHVPLLDELEAIVNNFTQSCIIAIDDVRLFGVTDVKVNWTDIGIDKIFQIVKPRYVESWLDSSELHVHDRLVLVLDKI